MGWDDIDLSKINAGMITLADTSDVNFAEYLNTFARALAEKQQVTEPSGYARVYDLGIEPIIFTGAPIGSKAFKDNFRRLLNEIRNKVLNVYQYGRENIIHNWYYTAVLTDYANHEDHIISQDDFKAAMGEPAYSAYIDVNPTHSDIAFDTLWTADVIRSIKPALELMQVFKPRRINIDPDGLILNQYAVLTDDPNVSYIKYRPNTPGQRNSGNPSPTWQQSYNANAVIYLDPTGNSWSGQTTYKFQFITSHGQVDFNPVAYGWDIGYHSPWSFSSQAWQVQDGTLHKYLAKDLSGITLNMEMVSVTKIKSNRQKSANIFGPLKAPYLPNYPYIDSSVDDPILIKMDRDSEVFTQEEGISKVFTFWSGEKPIPNHPLAEPVGYYENQSFEAYQDAAYVNTNNPALEFYIAP